MLNLATLVLSLFLAVTPLHASMTFDGNDEADCGDPTSPTGDEITIALWANFDDVTPATRNSIVSKFDSTVAVEYRVSLETDGDLRFVTGRPSGGSGDWRGCYVTTPFGAADTWYHIIAVRNGTSCTVYIDGQSQSLQSNTFDANNFDNSNVTMNIGTTDNNSGWMTGEVEEIYIWYSALSAAEVAQLYTRVKGIGLQIDSANLKHYFPMNQFEDGSAADGDTVLDMAGGTSGCTATSTP